MQRRDYRQIMAMAALAVFVFLGLIYLSRMGRDTSLEDIQRSINLAKAELAQRQGIPEESIQVIEASSVNWPDTSLGYPQPGMVYAQIITPGYRIILSDGKREYEYHSDRGNRVIFYPRQ